MNKFKWFIILYILLYASKVYSQSPYYNSFNYGNNYQRGIFQISLIIPVQDTILLTDSVRAGGLVMRPSDHKIYSYNGSSWQLASGVVAGFGLTNLPIGRISVDTTIVPKFGGNVLNSNLTIGTLDNKSFGIRTNNLEQFQITSGGSVLVSAVSSGIVSGGPYQLQVTGREGIVNTHQYLGLLYFLASDGTIKGYIDTNAAANISALRITSSLNLGGSSDTVLTISNGAVTGVLRSSISTTAGYGMTNLPTGSISADTGILIKQGKQTLGAPMDIGTRNNNTVSLSANNGNGLFTITNSGTRFTWSTLNAPGGTGNRYIYQNDNNSTNMTVGMVPYQILLNGRINGSSGSSIGAIKPWYWGSGTSTVTGLTFQIQGIDQLFWEYLLLNPAYLQTRRHLLIEKTTLFKSSISLTSLDSGSVCTELPDIVTINANGDSVKYNILGLKRIVNQTGKFIRALNYDSTELMSVDSAGNISATNLLSGIYTPTLTNVTNITASTAFVTGYYRVGTMVTVFGKININATLAASSSSELGVSLPIASNFTAEEDAGGTALSDAIASESIRIKADATNDRLSFVFKSISISNDSYNFQVSYRIK